MKLTREVKPKKFFDSCFYFLKLKKEDKRPSPQKSSKKVIFLKERQNDTFTNRRTI